MDSSAYSNPGRRNDLATVLLRQRPHDARCHLRYRAWAGEGRQRGHANTRQAARHDAGVRRQVHIHVEAEAVVAASAPHAQTQGSDFVVADVDAGRVRSCMTNDAVIRQHADESGLNAMHQGSHRQCAASQVEQQIGHELTGAVVGDLAAAVTPHDGDVAGGQKKLGLAGLSLGEDRLVFGKPDLVLGGAVASIGERAHRAKHVVVAGVGAKVADAQRAPWIAARQLAPLGWRSSACVASPLSSPSRSRNNR